MSDFISGLVLGLFCGGVFVAAALILVTMFRVKKLERNKTNEQIS